MFEYVVFDKVLHFPKPLSMGIPDSVYFLDRIFYLIVTNSHHDCSPISILSVSIYFNVNSRQLLVSDINAYVASYIEISK